MLTIKAVKRSDEGGYSARVTTQEASLTSATASVAVSIADSDHDGVGDDRDRFPGTPAHSVVNKQGASIDQLVPKRGPLTGGRWKSSQQYLAAYIRVVNEFRLAGLIDARTASVLVASATVASLRN